MRTLRAAALIDAPVERVWPVLADLSNPQIGAGITSRIEIDYRGEHPVRTLHLRPELGGGTVAEAIERLDAIAHVLAYRVIDRGPAPMTHYRGTFELTGRGPVTRLGYSAEFDALPANIDRLIDIAAGNFEKFAANLARMLGAPHSIERT